MKPTRLPWDRCGTLITFLLLTGTAQFVTAQLQAADESLDSATSASARLSADTGSPASAATGEEQLTVVRTQRHIGGLAAALGFGFLAGLVLNVMPCVLPVVSLKPRVRS